MDLLVRSELFYPLNYRGCAERLAQPLSLRRDTETGDELVLIETDNHLSLP